MSANRVPGDVVGVNDVDLRRLAVAVPCKDLEHDGRVLGSIDVFPLLDHVAFTAVPDGAVRVVVAGRQAVPSAGRTADDCTGKRLALAAVAVGYTAKVRPVPGEPRTKVPVERSLRGAPQALIVLVLGQCIADLPVRRVAPLIGHGRSLWTSLVRKLTAIHRLDPAPRAWRDGLCVRLTAHPPEDCKGEQKSAQCSAYHTMIPLFGTVVIRQETARYAYPVVGRSPALWNTRECVEKERDS